MGKRKGRGNEVGCNAVKKAKLSSTVNPFQEKRNGVLRKEILGQRVRGAKRDNIQAQKKNNEARKDLLKEYKSLNKTSSFQDKRLGENDENMEMDEKMAKRLKKMRNKTIKSSNFALGDDLLTHGGEALTRITDDMLNEDSKDLELEAEVEEELRKKGYGSIQDASNAGKTSQEVYDELMEKSKEIRRDRQMAREQAESDRNTFDTMFNELRGELDFKVPKSERPWEKREADDYDQLTRELQFERRVEATERLLTPEEVAAKKAKKLRELEADRIRRAQGEDDAQEESEVEEDKPADKDIEEEEESGDSDEEGEGEDEEDEEEGEGEDSECEDEAEEETGDDAVKAKKKSGAPKVSKAEKEVEEEVEEEEPTDVASLLKALGQMGSDDEEGSDDEDEDDSDEDGDEDKSEADEDVELKVDCLIADDEDAKDEDAADCDEEFVAPEVLTKFDPMINEDDEKDLPFHFDIPKNTAALERLLIDHPPQTQRKIISRIRLCAHSMVDKDSKKKIPVLLKTCLGWILGNKPLRQQHLNTVLLEVVEMVNEHKDIAWDFFKEHIQKMRTIKGLPSVADVRTVQLMGRLFPVTDYRHPIISPAMMLLDLWAGRLADKAKKQPLSVENVPLALLLIHALRVFNVGKFCLSYWRLLVTVLETTARSEAHTEWLLDVARSTTKLLCASLREGQRAHFIVVKHVLEAPLARALAAASKEFLPSIRLASDRVAAFATRQPLTSIQRKILKAQIKQLEPVFYDPKEQRAGKTDREKLKKALTQERRSAARQLRRDAMFMQNIKGQENQAHAADREKERKHHARVLDECDQNFRIMRTENAEMDTSLAMHKERRERKKSKRVGGDDKVKKEAKPKEKKIVKALRPSGKEKF